MGIERRQNGEGAELARECDDFGKRFSLQGEAAKKIRLKRSGHGFVHEPGHGAGNLFVRQVFAALKLRDE